MKLRLHRWAAREGRRGIRAYARLYDEESSKAELADGRLEGYIASGAQHTGVGLQADDDTAGVQLFVGVSKLACAWITLGFPRLAYAIQRRWKLALPDVNIAQVRVHDGAVWWEVWHDKWGWTRGTPCWRYGNFNPFDFVLGRHVHSKEIVDMRAVGVPMPEGVYRATVTLELSRWKRPRWPWAKYVRTYEIDVHSRPSANGPRIEWDPDTGEQRSGYIPVPGKGENSWDCGGDGTFSMHGPGANVEDAISALVHSTLRDRRRRGADPAYCEPIS